MNAITREKYRDLVRVGLQTGASVGVVYVVMRWYGLEHLSWAVISALFTIRLSSDTTLSVGVWRVVAALIGTVLGLAAVVVFHGPYQVLLAVVTASILANLITTLRPNLFYVSVAASIVALNADAEIVESFRRALAIVIGSTAGTLASFLVWPEFARSRALRNLGYAIDDCRALAETSFEGLAGAANDQDDPRARSRTIGETFARHLGTARQLSGNSRFRRVLASGHTLDEVIVAVERLWHAVVVLDRAGAEHRGGLWRDDMSALSPDIETIGDETARYLRAVVARFERNGAPLPERSRVAARLREAEEALRRTPTERGAVDDEERERAVAALRFGIAELAKNLRELDGFIARGGDDEVGGGSSSGGDRNGEDEGHRTPRRAREPAH